VFTQLNSTRIKTKPLIPEMKRSHYSHYLPLQNSAEQLASFHEREVVKVTLKKKKKD
jgi:hypothetical protein